MRFLHRAVLALPALAMLGVSHDAMLLAPPALHAQEPMAAEAPIWGANNGFKGYAFLPVTIQGHKATVVINLNCTQCDLQLSSAALQKAGITPPDANATSLGEITIGTDVQHNVPLSVNTKPTWSVSGPDSLAPVVGVVGVHFLTTHYDILYDFPGRKVQLFSLKPAPASKAWLPAGFTSADCGKMVDIPPGAATFTGYEMKVDGKPMIGALEMGPYIPKMNEIGYKTLGIAEGSPRLGMGNRSTDGGHRVVTNVKDVPMTVGTNTFGSWNTEVLEELDVQSLLGPKPIMLMNLSMLRNVRLFNSTSSKQVCIAK